MNVTTELPRDVLHEITSTPIAGVAYVVRINTSLKVYVHHGDLWNYCGRLDCTPGQDSLQLIADHFAGVLHKNRRIEQRWRGQITAERIEWDHRYAYDLHAEMGYYSPYHCECCGLELPSHFDGCPLDPEVIIAAGARIAVLTVDDLTDEMIDMFISGSTCRCPHCGESILAGCGRHVAARHAGVTR